MTFKLYTQVGISEYIIWQCPVGSYIQDYHIFKVRIPMGGYHHLIVL